MKKRYRRLWGLAGVLLLLAAVGYAALHLWRTGKSEAGPAVGRLRMSLPPAEYDGEALGEPLSYVGPPPTEKQLQAAVKGANLLICVLDGARYDHLGCSGYPRETSPNIDRLASQSILFTQHFCQIPHTRPSTTSLLTSQYPDTHGLLGTFGELSSSFFSMESGLKAAGWHTAFFTSNIQACPDMGLGTDFELIVRGWPRFIAGAPASMMDTTGKPEMLLQGISEWLDKRPHQPFFAYIHFRPPHVPFNAPERFHDELAAADALNAQTGMGRPDQDDAPDAASEGGDSDTDPTSRLNLYDVNMRYADWAFGELEKLLRQHGLFGNTLLILTADHGETLGEREHPSVMTEGAWRQLCLYDEAVHIPLVVKLPGESGPVGTVSALTQTVDLLPTVFDLLSIPYPRERVQGRSLVPLLSGNTKQVNQYVFVRTAEEPDPEKSKDSEVPQSYLVRSLGRALILHQGGEHQEFYDLSADPGQTRNIIAEQPHQADRLIQAFRAFAVTQATPPLDFLDPRYKPPPAPDTPALEMTDEVREQLRALGYLN